MKSQSKQPLVSVIIPTHNRVDYLLEAVDSAIGQTFQNFEILVVVDHCNDDTLAQLQLLKVKYDKLEEAYEKMVILENKDLPGSNVCRNLAAKNAKGLWLAFLDDDDLWTSNKLEVFLKTLEQEKFQQSNFFFHSRQALIGSELKKVSHAKWIPNIEVEILKDNCIGITSAIVLKKELFEKVEGFDRTISALQDWDLWIRLAPHMIMSFSDEVLTHYRVHNGVRISRDLERFEQAKEIILKKYPQYSLELTKSLKKIRIKKQIKNFLNL